MCLCSFVRGQTISGDLGSGAGRPTVSSLGKAVLCVVSNEFLPKLVYTPTCFRSRSDKISVKKKQNFDQPRAQTVEADVLSPDSRQHVLRVCSDFHFLLVRMKGLHA